MLVNNIEELRSAIENNETEIILAESGDFVDESTKFDRSQIVSLENKDEITIRSEDPNNPETLVGLDIIRADNIRVENLKLIGWNKDENDPNENSRVKAAAGNVEYSDNIVFSNVIFEGRDDLALEGDGFRSHYSDNVTVENSQFSGYRKALVGSNSENFKVTGNEFVEVVVDAMAFRNPKSLTIEDNIVRDFNSELRDSIDLEKNPGADHGDAIQFTVVDFEAKDISIKNNAILIGDGADFQGIFLKTNHKGISGSLNNVDIENNLIHTTMLRGIYLGEGKNINIKDNTVVFRDSEQIAKSKTSKSGVIVDNAENLVVENNIAGFFKLNGQRFGGGISSKFKEPINGNIAANFESFGLDLPYEEVFVNGDKLTDPEFYSTVSPEGFAVLDGIDAGANLGQLPDTTAGEPIGGISVGNEGTEAETQDSILISFDNANENGDVFGTAGADYLKADADNSSDDRLRGLGRDGNDTLIGANNVDLAGEKGNDELILNGGDSFIRGGSGSDTFIITSETESGSTILDFEKGIDTIVFEDIQGISSISDLDITPQNQNFTANSIISFGDEQIKFKDMTVDDFSSGDFEFI